MVRLMAISLLLVSLCCGIVSVFAAMEYTSRESEAYGGSAGPPPKAPGLVRPYNPTGRQQSEWNFYESRRAAWEPKKRDQDRQNAIGQKRLSNLRFWIKLSSVITFLYCTSCFVVFWRKTSSAFRWLYFGLAVVSFLMIGWSIILSGGIGFDEVWGAWLASFAVFFFASISALFVSSPERKS